MALAAQAAKAIIFAIAEFNIRSARIRFCLIGIERRLSYTWRTFNN